MDANPGLGRALPDLLPIQMTDASWFKRRRYAHFDLSICEADAIKYVSEPTNITRHSFFPFLAYDLKFRRYKSSEKGADVSTKRRPIRVAAHRDGYIFAYYAHLLSQAYEGFVNPGAISRCSLAYRKNLGSNIEFSNAAFTEIETRKNCIAIAMDLKDFFDSIDHQVLKSQWCHVLGEKRLPSDHYAVFRGMTRYAYVNREECFEALKIENVKSAPHPLCDAKQFRDVIRSKKIIRVNLNQYGIPQGAPMSAVLSNIYMIPFDQKMVELEQEVGGYYRRYCDDILWIAPAEHADTIQNRTISTLSDQGSALGINHAKTTVSRFVDGKVSEGPIVQYLGFTFDGKNRRIRSQTLSKFWRKVVFGVRAARRRARSASSEGGDGKLYKRKIYRRFTHLGRRNFLSYARRAWSKPGAGGVRKQLRRHWERIQKEINEPLK